MVARKVGTRNQVAVALTLLLTVGIGLSIVETDYREATAGVSGLVLVYFWYSARRPDHGHSSDPDHTRMDREQDGEDRQGNNDPGGI